MLYNLAVKAKVSNRTELRLAKALMRSLMFWVNI
uniref:Uncharacterized protein n=1 Tax=Anguilla anguilla TaxID=7936 RepID=A0A0E9WDK8_ANGAN